MAYPADESLILTLSLPHQTELNRTDDDSFALNIVLLAVDYYMYQNILRRPVGGQHG